MSFCRMMNFFYLSGVIVFWCLAKLTNAEPTTTTLTTPTTTGLFSTLIRRARFRGGDQHSTESAAFTISPLPTHTIHPDHETATTRTEYTPAAGNQKPERGKFLPTPFAEQDLHNTYIELRETYRKISETEEGWKLLNEKDGVKVSLLNHPSDPWCPYVRMKSIFPVSVESCWNFLRVPNWDVSMPKMDPFYEGVTIYQNVSCNGITLLLCRKRMKRILAFGKRDLAFLSVTEDDPLPDGTWVSGTVSVRTKQIPRMPGYVRAFQDSVAFYKPLQNNTKCEICITCRIDLNDSGEGGEGGFIPMWLYVKTIGRTGVQSIARMRQALMEEEAAAEANRKQQQQEMAAMMTTAQD